MIFRGALLLYDHADEASASSVKASCGHSVRYLRRVLILLESPGFSRLTEIVASLHSSPLGHSPVSTKLHPKEGSLDLKLF